MTKVTYYIADDGTKFCDEWKCQRYEQDIRMTQYKNTALLFNEEGELLPLCDESIQEAFYIYAVTDDAAHFITEEFGTDYNIPWSFNSESRYPRAGIWIFYNSEWIPKSRIDKISAIFSKIQER